MRGVPARFVKLDTEINTAMPERVAGKVVEAADEAMRPAFASHVTAVAGRAHARLRVDLA